MSPPCRGVLDRMCTGATVLFAFSIDDLLQIVTVLDELKSLKIASPTPLFLESVDLRYGETGSAALSHARSEFPLIFHERPVPDDAGGGRFVLLEKNLAAVGRHRAIGDSHHSGAKYLCDLVPFDDVSDFQFLCHEGSLGLERDSLRRSRHTGSELFQGCAEADRIGSEFLQCVLRA